MAKRKKTENTIVRYNPTVKVGLNSVQVAEREKNKLTNHFKQKSSKSVLKILVENIFTFFNLIWAVIFVALLLIESYDNLFFIVVVSLNTIIAIVQEIKAKNVVEKLKIVTTPKVKAVRSGKVLNLTANKLVLDDIIILSVGNQVPSDCILVEGIVDVNESLLTGESRAVRKKEGDQLFAGSFLTSGQCYAKVNRVGKQNYIQTISLQAKKFKSPYSNLFKDLKTIIKYIGIMIIPFGALLFVNNYFNGARDLHDAIKNTCGSLIGMIPAGMFLLITIALSVGVIKLARKKTLVKEIYSIEMLARTNVLCLDKTGTITDGSLQLKEVEKLVKKLDFDLDKAMANYLRGQLATNSTSRAMIDYFGVKNDLSLISKVEFSSERKFSAASFEEIGSIVVGAPEFLGVELTSSLKAKIKKHTIKGERVLMVAHSEEKVEENLPKLKPIALLIMEDRIRADAIDIINWFKQNDVEIKIISGDNATTVSSIAKRVGIEGAEKTISLEGMSIPDVAKIADKYTVFGRVSPEQKHALIKALKNKGKVVAMTGDGVNDTLALKEADCSIAMADGSEVARGLSDIVLLDSKFSSLPEVVREGRKVVNNVQQSSTLFLMKTFFTITLSLLSLLTLSNYPFEPKNLYLLELLIIGIPSVILALQPNDKIITSDFVKQVLKNAIPYGTLIVANIIAVMFIERYVPIDENTFMTLGTLLITTIGFLNLARLCYPFTILKVATLITSFVLIVCSILIMPEFFGITSFTTSATIIYVILTLISALILIVATPIKNKFLNITVKKAK